MQLTINTKVCKVRQVTSNVDQIYSNFCCSNFQVFLKLNECFYIRVVSQVVKSCVSYVSMCLHQQFSVILSVHAILTSKWSRQGGWGEGYIRSQWHIETEQGVAECFSWGRYLVVVTTTTLSRWRILMGMIIFIITIRRGNILLQGQWPEYCLIIGELNKMYDSTFLTNLDLIFIKSLPGSPKCELSAGWWKTWILVEAVRKKSSVSPKLEM